jgi:tetratricopeptide (TPR) repeat protein
MRSKSSVHLRAVWYLGMIMVVLITIPRLAVDGLKNWGDNLYLRSVKESERPAEEYPHWAVDPIPDSGWQAYHLLQALSKVDVSDVAVQWAYGRAALFVGSAVEATSALPLDIRALTHNPLRYLDTITAYSQAGLDDQVLALYRQIPPIGAHQVITNAVVVAYLHSAQSRLSAGTDEQAQRPLLEAVAVSPGDVYAYYYLWRGAVLAGETEKAGLYRQQLARFPSVAAIVDDERLLNPTCEIVPRLLSEGIWSLEQTQNVLSYWIWRRPQSPCIALILEMLSRERPQEAIWPFYLGEIHQRLGQIEPAREYYQQAMALDDQNGAFLAQQRLSEVQPKQTTGFPQSVEQDIAIAATLLGIPETQVRLGPTLIQDQTPKQISEHWVCETFGGTRGWPFVAGIDRVEASGSLRLANLWWPEIDPNPQYTPYSECRSPAMRVAGNWLMASLWYRVDGGRDLAGASALIADATSPDWRPYFVEVGLPDTGGKWIHLIAVGRVSTLSTSLFLSIRNTRVANAWFRDVVVQVIEPLAPPVNCLDKPCIEPLGSGH